MVQIKVSYKQKETVPKASPWNRFTAIYSSVIKPLLNRMEGLVRNACAFVAWLVVAVLVPGRPHGWV